MCYVTEECVRQQLVPSYLEDNLEQIHFVIFYKQKTGRTNFSNIFYGSMAIHKLPSVHMDNSIETSRVTFEKICKTILTAIPTLFSVSLS